MLYAKFDGNSLTIFKVMLRRTLGLLFSGHAVFVVFVVAGRSGLAVACLTAVRVVLGSNRAMGSCVYRKNLL